MRFINKALAPLVAIAAISAPAFAAPQQDDVVTVRIAYGDIDLTSAEGRAKLEQRVEAQLRKACTIESASRYSYRREVLDAKCVADARTAAFAKVERVVAAQTRAGRQVAAN